ncbi:MAG: GNAT family N-acetyltransferase [Bryobacterales bacterium]
MPRIEDLSLVRPVLRRDPAWSLYALADLEPAHSAFAEWYAPDDAGRCAVLLYRGFGFSIFLDSGDFDAVAETLSELEEERFYLSIRKPTLELLRQAGYAVPKLKRMLRMRLDVERFHTEAGDSAVRLSAKDLPKLKALYADGDGSGEAPEFFRDSMLDEGVYYAVPVPGGYAAAAGTHIVEPAQDVAGVGNIYTRRDLRRQGHARQATAAVLSRLVSRRFETICLNVVAENTAAADLYRSLGFELHCEYYEGEAIRIA